MPSNPSDGEHTVIADDVSFGEGPVWCADTGTVVCTAVASGRLHRIWPSEWRSEVLIDLGGGPNACAPATDGGFLVTQNGGMDFAALGLPGFENVGPMRPQEPGLVHVAVDGSVTYLATEDENGQHLSAPNDLVTMPDGSVYFTDPGHHPPPAEPAGRLLRLYPDGRVENVGGTFHYCNGVARDHLGRLLVIEANGLLRVEHDGRQEWLVEDFGGVAGDGMAVDTEGRVHVCCPGDDRIRVVSPAGEIESVIDLAAGSLPTNCCFGGPDGTDLFVTLALHRSVVALGGRPHPGVPVIAWQPPPTAADRPETVQ